MYGSHSERQQREDTHHVSIIRAPRPEAGYTVIRDDVLRDDRLSYRARGILAVILSRPDNWRTDSVGLCRTGTEGREAIRSALRELEGAGYIVRQRLQDERGRWRQVALVYDTPQPIQETLDLVSNQDGFPTPGNPAPGEPAPGEPAAGGLGAIRSTEKDNPEGTTPADSIGDGKPPSVAQQFAREVVPVVMENRGSLMVDAAAVNAVARRYRTLAGASAASPEQFASAYLYLRGQGITKPNAERVAEALALKGRRVGDTHDAHWATPGAAFSMD